LNSARDWVEADLPEERLRSLVVDEELSLPLARYYLRRAGEDFSPQQEASSGDEPPRFHKPLVGLLELTQFLVPLLRRGETINLAAADSATAYLSLSLVGFALNKLGGSVHCCSCVDDFSSPGLIFLDGSTELEESLSAIKTGESALITPEPQNGPLAEDIKVVCPSEDHISLPIISYRLSEAVSRKIYGAELPSFVAFDLETTGKSPRTSEIIEIGAVKYRNGCVIEEFESFVGSVDTIPDGISDLTGIENSDLMGAPAPEEALNQFKDFFSDYRLVAHNKGFDIPFLKYHLKKHCGASLNNSTGDSMRAAQSSFPGLPGYGLSDVAGYLGVELESHHRAMDDARAAGEIYKLARCKTPRQVREVLDALAPLASLAMLSAADFSSADERNLFSYGQRILKEEPGRFPKNLESLAEPGLVRYRNWPLDLLVNLHLHWRKWAKRGKLVFSFTDSAEDKDFSGFSSSNGKSDYFQKNYEQWIEESGNVYDAELNLNSLLKIYPELPFDADSPPFTVKLTGVRVINCRLRESPAGKFYQLTVADGSQWLTAVAFCSSQELEEIKTDSEVELLGIPTAGLIGNQQPVLQIIGEVKYSE